MGSTRDVEPLEFLVHQDHGFLFAPGATGVVPPGVPGAGQGPLFADEISDEQLGRVDWGDDDGGGLGGFELELDGILDQPRLSSPDLATTRKGPLSPRQSARDAQLLLARVPPRSSCSSPPLGWARLARALASLRHRRVS